MKNLWGPGMWQGGPGRGFRPGGEKAMRSFLQSILTGQKLARTARHKNRRLRVLKALDTFRERHERALTALRSRLEKGIDEEPTSLYENNGRFNRSSDPYDTSEVTDEMAYEVTAAEVNTRALYTVFEALTKRDLNPNGTPKASVVNDKLEDKGHERVDKEKIDDLYRQWAQETRSTAKAPTKSGAKKKRKARKKAGKGATTRA